MVDLFGERVWGIPWTVVALLALAIAVVFVFVDTSAAATGLRFVIVRWFHSLCWLLLALAALAMARVTPIPVAWAGPLATLGGLTYAAFLAATLFWRG